VSSIESTPPKPASQPDVFTRAANGEGAGSYYTDGRWNRGGWATYPSTDELAISGATEVTTVEPAEGIRILEKR
jgi:hypothetical protein